MSTFDKSGDSEQTRNWLNSNAFPNECFKNFNGEALVALDKEDILGCFKVKEEGLRLWALLKSAREGIH